MAFAQLHDIAQKAALGEPVVCSRARVAARYSLGEGSPGVTAEKDSDHRSRRTDRPDPYASYARHMPMLGRFSVIYLIASAIFVVVIVIVLTVMYG